MRKKGIIGSKMVVDERNRMLRNKEKFTDQSKSVTFSSTVVINTYSAIEPASKNRLSTEPDYKDEVRFIILKRDFSG